MLVTNTAHDDDDRVGRAQEVLPNKQLGILLSSLEWALWLQ